MSQGTYQKIHRAALEGILEMLIQCVEEGENPNAVSDEDFTPLHYAAYAGHSAVVKHLIKHVTSVDAPDIHGATPILMAVYGGQVDTFDLLVRAGANTNLHDRYGQTLLHDVCSRGMTRFAETLIESGVDKNAQDLSGNTPLMEACCYEKNVDTVALLLSAGVDKDKTDNEGWTPLQIACKKGHWSIIQLLLRHGADPNVLNHRGQSALHTACAMVKEDTERILPLLAAGVDKDKTDTEGWTPLHLSCEKGHWSIIQLLLLHGADPNVLNHRGQSALHTVCAMVKEDTPAAFLILLVAGIDKDKTDSEGWTPLHLACKKGHCVIIELLLAHGAAYGAGADPNVQNHRGESALHTACTTGEDIVSILLEFDADVHVRDDEGATPLHRAMRNPCDTFNDIAEMVAMLLRSGADPAAKDNNGDTPYSICLANIKCSSYTISSYVMREVKSAMIEHLIKLKLAGLPVTTDTIAASDAEAYGHFQYECLRELEKAKKLKVYENFTIGGVLLKRNEPYYCANSELLKTLQETMNSPMFLQEFPIYGYVFRLVLKSSKIRYRLLDCALESLKSDTRIKFVREMDDLVKQQILAYLNNDQLKSLIDSV